MTENELNGVVAQYFDTLEVELNKNTTQLQIQPGGIYHVPTIVSLGNYTKLDPTAGATNLSSPMAGMIRDIPKTEDDQNIIVIRRMISYVTAARICANPSEHLEKQLRPFTTEMLMTLKHAIGFGPNVPNAGKVYATFLRPGITPGVYFKDVDDSAAFELRLYSNTWSCISPELLHLY